MYRMPLIVLSLLYIAFIALLIVTAGSLPERMATHFNLTGQADDWMSRKDYLAMMAVFGLIFPPMLPALFLMLRTIPTSGFNMPYRDYWLAPEREAETRNYFVRHALWFACLQMAFFIALHVLSVLANRQTPPHLSNAIWGCALVFLSGTAVWVWRMVRRFGKPPELV
jgi:uncharacterized membrane protein